MLDCLCYLRGHSIISRSISTAHFFCWWYSFWWFYSVPIFVSADIPSKKWTATDFGKEFLICLVDSTHRTKAQNIKKKTVRIIIPNKHQETYYKPDSSLFKTFKSNHHGCHPPMMLRSHLHASNCSYAMVQDVPRSTSNARKADTSRLRPSWKASRGFRQEKLKFLAEENWVSLDVDVCFPSWILAWKQGNGSRCFFLVVFFSGFLGIGLVVLNSRGSHHKMFT